MLSSSLFRDLKRLVASEQQHYITKNGNNQQHQQLASLKGLPFYRFDLSEEEHRRLAIDTDDSCCFNHLIGLPEKNRLAMPLFDYEKTVFDSLFKQDGSANYKHLFILKATGLGISELILRIIAWICLKDNKLSGTQIVIFTGPRIDLAITLIDRLKKLFYTKNLATFETKETVIALNNVKVEAYPSHHVDAARGLSNVSFIFLDEGDFFTASEQSACRDVAERYIGKSNPWIVLVSTPNKPDGLFQRIEQEPEDICIYKRLRLDYTVGLGKIYSPDEIEKAKQSPSFAREFDLKYLGHIGNVFHSNSIDAAIEKGRKYDPDNFNPYSHFTSVSMGIDPAYGSSAFGICITQWEDNQIRILYAEEYHRPDYNEMLAKVYELMSKYQVDSVYIDGANPSFIKSLKIQIGENPDYDKVIAQYKKDGYEGDSWTKQMRIIPVHFAKEHKAMLGHCKMILEDGYLAIHSKFDKLITSIRTATDIDGTLDKENTSYSDIFDAFRLSLKFYHFEES